MTDMLNLQIQIFLLLGIGYFLGCKEMITRSALSQLTGLIVNVILPAAIIRSFQMNITAELLKETGTILLLSVLIQFGAIGLNAFLWKKCKDRKKRINLEYGTVVNNAGTLGMVIAEAAFGEEGLLFASVFMIPVRIMMWSYGLALYDSKGKKGSLWKVLLHPCIVAVGIGIVLMLLQSNGILLPGFAQKTLDAVANCNTALVMFAIGVILSEVPAKEIVDKWAGIYSAVRLIVIPAVLFVILKLLPLPALPVNVAIIETAMPAASTMAMLAQKYDMDSRFASKMIFISTLCSLITMPIWTWLFTVIQ